MDAESKDYNDKINRTLIRIDTYNKEAQNLSDKMEELITAYTEGYVIDYKQFNTIQAKLRRLNKKITDCQSTIAKYSSMITYEVSDFLNDANKINYRIGVENDTFPTSVKTNTKFYAKITVKNYGRNTWSTSTSKVRVTLMQEGNLSTYTNEFNVASEIKTGECFLVSDYECDGVAASGMYTISVELITTVDEEEIISKASFEKYIYVV